MKESKSEVFKKMNWENKKIEIATRDGARHIDAEVYGPLAITVSLRAGILYGEDFRQITHVETGMCFPHEFAINSEQDYENLKKAVESICTLIDWSISDIQAIRESLKGGVLIHRTYKEFELKVVR